MAQEYYSLEEAAQKLRLPVDELREMAKKGRDVRAFRDGPSWKFRGSDIDELARKRSLISDPDLGSGDSIHGDEDSILSADDMPALIDEGALSGLGLGSSLKGKGSDSGTKKGPGSGGSGKGLGSGAGGPGSGVKGPGSDIQLAFDDDVLFNAPGSSKNPSDSDVKLAIDESTGLSGILSSGPKSGGLKDSPGVGPKSGAKSDLDSTAQLPPGYRPPGGPKTPASGVKKGDLESTAAMNVDDIDFDDSGLGMKIDDSPSSTKPKGDSRKKFDKTQDFDDIKLSDSDAMGLGSSGDLKLQDSDELKLSGDSGIGVRKPNDSGINLADADDSSEFELSVDSTDSLPSFKDSDDDVPVAPVKSSTAKGKAKEEDNASEFELALDEDDSASEIEVESGSEVVALDEEEGAEYDEAESDYGDYEDEPTASAGAVGAVAGAGAIAAEAAPWPAWTIVPLLLTTVAVCLGGIVVVEVMRNAFTYQDGMPIAGSLASAEWLKSFAGLFGGK